MDIERISWTNSNFTIKIQGFAMDKSKFASKPHVKYYMGLKSKKARNQGLTIFSYGRKFKRFGRNFSVVGFNERAQKYALIAEDDKAKLFKFPVSVLK